MKETKCNHCGMAFDGNIDACPYCNTPAPERNDGEKTQTGTKFIRFFLILVIFCIFMMLWLPRDI